jgi:hypothetical protein
MSTKWVIDSTLQKLVLLKLLQVFTNVSGKFNAFEATIENDEEF